MGRRIDPSWWPTEQLGGGGGGGGAYFDLQINFVSI